MDPVTLFTILVWLAVAKGAVYILEDAAYGVVRGKQSPRQRERAAHQAAERAAAAAGQPAPPPSGNWGRTKTAVGDYLAGVVEDATATARSRKRRAQARRAGAQATDGVFVDHDEDGFVADCDICGWCSRRFRIEANALAAGREHTRTEHPEQYHPDPTPDEPTEQPQGAGQAAPDPDVVDMATVLACGQCPRGVIREGQCDGCGRIVPQAGASAGERPQLRVIPGGAKATPAPGGTPASAPQPAGSAAQAGGTTPPADDSDLMALVDATQDSGAGTPAGTGQHNRKGNTTVNFEAMGADEIRAAFADAIADADNHANELDELAKGLAAAAEDYANRQMAATTVEEITEASEAAQVAVAQLQQAKEHLETALADFNKRDGVVADTVTEVGNLADSTVLVGN
ncbi:hypothetical protein [Krasilnikovia sp. MM14-A1259]|uniref:hypothetical protein n=1 Tax=Krasilnikovia sp. MM14-A1259 TaxID=3373539 RepID=UPI00380B42E5